VPGCPSGKVTLGLGLVPCELETLCPLRGAVAAAAPVVPILLAYATRSPVEYAWLPMPMLPANALSWSRPTFALVVDPNVPRPPPGNNCCMCSSPNPKLAKYSSSSRASVMVKPDMEDKNDGGAAELKMPAPGAPLVLLPRVVPAVGGRSTCPEFGAEGIV
jgi:hypothetical protein